MNQFEKWLVNNIIKREVVQGHNHARNIEVLTAYENPTKSKEIG